jgi:phage-related protein
VNSPGDTTCRKKINKAPTPFLHAHGAKQVQLWAVPKMLRVFVRTLAIRSPEVVSSRKVNTTLSLCLAKRLEKKMHGGLCHSFMHI